MSCHCKSARLTFDFINHNDINRSRRQTEKTRQPKKAKINQEFQTNMKREEIKSSADRHGDEAHNGERQPTSGRRSKRMQRGHWASLRFVAGLALVLSIELLSSFTLNVHSIGESITPSVVSYYYPTKASR